MTTEEELFGVLILMAREKVIGDSSCRKTIILSFMIKMTLLFGLVTLMARVQDKLSSSYIIMET